MLTTCHAGDPALAGLPRDWWQTRDMASLPEGLDPVVYSFHRLTRAQRTLVHGAGSDEDRYEWSFLAGVRSVAGGRFGAAGWRPAYLLTPGAQKVAMDPDEADAQFTPAEMIDIGEWIYKTSILGKASGLRLPLSPTSRLALDARARPSAERSPE